MNVEDQLRDYKTTLDAASDQAGDARMPRAVAPVRIRPARTLVLAAVAVAATVAVAFAAVGVAHHHSTPPAAIDTTTTPTSASSPITAVHYVVVPNVIGLKLSDAVARISRVGLNTVTVGTNMSCSSSSGLVAREDPVAGTRITTNHIVALVSCDQPPRPATTALPVVACPTQYGIVPAPAPHTPTSVTIAAPPFSSPALSGYSDATGYVTTTAPVGWSCQAEVAADGNVTLTLTPPAPGIGSVEVSDYPACQGCVYDAVCAVVPSAAADFPDQARVPCSSLATGARVTPLGKNVYEIYEPAFLARQQPVRTVLRYRPPNASAGGASVRETCALPTPQASECEALLAEFLALNPSAG